MFKKINFKSKLMLITFLLFIIVIYCYSNIQYSQRYNIIIENQTNSNINHICFKTDQNEEGLKIIDIAPHEIIKVSRDFDKVTDSFIALIDTPKETDKVIPLAYIYSPNTVTIVKLIIIETENNKITKLTLKSFDNYFSVIPWWIRTLYDYTTTTYDMLLEN